MSGTLVLIAGPSGAGKDTLIGLAREKLGEDGRFVFARRMITRPADAGGEDHVAATREEFARLHSEGVFALAWEAHGLCYGVPKSIEGELAQGRVVIVNVSRAIIADAAQHYPRCCAVIVTASPERLAQRLAARGREPADALKARLARPSGVPTGNARSAVIENDGTPEEGRDKLVAILLALAAAAPVTIATTNSAKSATRTETTA